MSVRSSLLTFGLLVAASQVFSSPFKLYPGYYLSNSGDSVLCDFRFSDWNTNPKTIQVTVGNKTQTLGVTDIKGFGVFGYGNYKTATVTYHTNKIAGTSLPEEFTDDTESSTNFLKLLVSGNYNLYELNLPSRQYFFASPQNGEITELVFRVRQKDMRVDEDPRYRQQLYALFSNGPISNENNKKITSAHYTSADLSSVFRQLNGTSITVDALKVKDESLEFELFAGALVNSFENEWNGHYSKGNKFSSSISPTFGVNLLYFVPGNFRSFALGLSLGYNKYSIENNKTDSVVFYSSPAWHNTTQYNEKIHSSNSMMMTSLYGMYFINKKSKARVYVKAGANVNISLTKERNMYSSYHATGSGVYNGNPTGVSTYDSDGDVIMETTSTFFSWMLGLGVSAGRSKLELAYFAPTNMSTEGDFKISTIGGKYYFTLFK